ncbi:Enolase 1, chloroplastic [Capsicum annuum]|nr:Enolase 1, chloroplastic [Capsicum annuum]
MSISCSIIVAPSETTSKTASKVKYVKERYIIYNRGNTTIEVDLVTTDDPLYQPAVLSGSSIGIYEALELRDGDKNYHTLKGIIKAKYGKDACNADDEGGFASNVQDNREGLINIVMDVAASEFLTKYANYPLNFKNQPNDGAHVLSNQGLCEVYKEFVKDFPIVSIEDPFDQDDWSSWASL